MKEEELKVLILEGYQSGTKRFYGGTSLHTLIFSEIVYLPAYTFRGGTSEKKTPCMYDDHFKVVNVYAVNRDSSCQEKQLVFKRNEL